MSCSFFLLLPILLESIAIKLSIMTQQGLSFPILVLESKIEKKKKEKNVTLASVYVETKTSAQIGSFFHGKLAVEFRGRKKKYNTRYIPFFLLLRPLKAAAALRF